MAAVQLENLVRIGQLQRKAPLADELAGLKRSAESRLADVLRPDLSLRKPLQLGLQCRHALALIACGVPDTALRPSSPCFRHWPTRRAWSRHSGAHW